MSLSNGLRPIEHEPFDKEEFRRKNLGHPYFMGLIHLENDDH